MITWEITKIQLVGGEYLPLDTANERIFRGSNNFRNINLNCKLTCTPNYTITEEEKQDKKEKLPLGVTRTGQAGFQPSGANVWKKKSIFRSIKKGTKKVLKRRVRMPSSESPTTIKKGEKIKHRMEHVNGYMHSYYIFSLID